MEYAKDRETMWRQAEEDFKEHQRTIFRIARFCARRSYSDRIVNFTEVELHDVWHDTLCRLLARDFLDDCVPLDELKAHRRARGVRPDSLRADVDIALAYPQYESFTSYRVIDTARMLREFSLELQAWIHSSPVVRVPSNAEFHTAVPFEDFHSREYRDDASDTEYTFEPWVLEVAATLYDEHELFGLIYLTSLMADEAPTKILRQLGIKSDNLDKNTLAAQQRVVNRYVEQHEEEMKDLLKCHPAMLEAWIS
jgi:hypothetical protein